MYSYHRNIHLHELQPTQSPSNLPETYSPFILYHVRQQLSQDRGEKLWCTCVESILEAIPSHCLKPSCSPWKNTALPFHVLLSAQQNVSQKLLTGIPAKDAPQFKPIVLCTLTDAYLQLCHHAGIIQQCH